MYSKIKHCFTFRKFPTSPVGLVDKIASIILIVILLGSVGSAGSLYSINMESNKEQSLSNGPSLFPTLKKASALPDQNKNCDSNEVTEEEKDNFFKAFNKTKLNKSHPEFLVNKTKGELMVTDKNNKTQMVNAHSPFGKIIQEKQKGKSDNNKNNNVIVNCHMLLMIKEHVGNATHKKFEIETFTSVKIKPCNGNQCKEGEQGAWGDVIVKNNSTNVAPDLGLNLTSFQTAEVFLDSLSTVGKYDAGEFIYSNSTDTTVGENHVRLFANYTDLGLGENVTSLDDDHGKKPLVNFNATVMYYDRNGDEFFSANETVYWDVDNSTTITDNDVRLVNARFVGNITDSSLQYQDGKKANFPNISEGIGNFTAFIEECEKDNMGFYNNTIDSCNYTKKFGKEMEKELNKRNNVEVKFKNKGPDLKNSIKPFSNDVVFLDSNSNVIFDIGETIYLQKGGGFKVQLGDERLTSYENFTAGSIVIFGDNDHLKEKLENFNSTTKYFDKDGDDRFDINETVYNDLQAPGSNKVNAGDVRLVNARFVGDFMEFEDGSKVYQKATFEDMTNNGMGMGMGKGKDIDIGMEDRQFNITENLILIVANNSTNATSSFDSVISALSKSVSLDDAANSEGLIVAEDPQIILDPISQDILFGDTIAPSVRFGFGINIESCFWIFGCVTWFKIGVFFTPYIITGFRLPGRVTAYNIPDREFATKNFTIKSDFEGFDASYQEYIQICENNELNNRGYFSGPSSSTPFGCKDFASYDAMSIPSVLNAISDDLVDVFTNPARIHEAPDKFIRIAKILFNPLPPTNVDQVVDRISSSGLGIGTNNDEVKDLISGQEVVLQAGVIIEVELVILNIEILDIRQDVRLDLLGMIQGFLLYNEIVQSSSPTIYKKEYAKGGVAGPNADYVKIWELISDYDKLKEKNIVFTSFKTPYGFNDDGSIASIPFLSGEGVPVLSNTDKGYNILYLRGNCIGAYLDGQILKFPAPYGPAPLCSGLWLPGFAEAILGIKSGLGSVRVDASMLPEGDADKIPNEGVFSCAEKIDDYNPKSRLDNKKISYCAYFDPPTTDGQKSLNITRTISVDNFDPTTDDAKIKIDNFIYNLQWITIGDLLINFEAPVKWFLPTDIHELRINIFTKVFDVLQVPQHPRVSGLTGVDVRVFNYALDMNNPNDPINPPNGTKPIKAGNFTNQPELRSNATVTYTNIGNSLDKIHDLKIEFPPVHPDGTKEWMSIPNQTELDDEEFNNLMRDDTRDLVFGINPPRHHTTTPSYLVGLYDVILYATSSNATKHGMDPVDPLGNARINATHILKINVTQFGAPELNYTEAITETKPGNLTEYNARIANMGNGYDIIPLTQILVDSNKIGCDLFDKGPDNENCPFRANYTTLQESWTNYTKLCNVYWLGVLPCDDEIPDPVLPYIPPNEEDVGFTVNNATQQYRQYGLENATSRSQNFTTTIPSGWAGIDDTVYKIKGTVLSTADPPESDVKFVEHTVIATKESSVRYIALEINAMKDKVTNANVPEMIDKGSQTALTQILDRAIKTSNERAFANVCDGNLRGTNGGLMTTQHQLEGMVQAINGMTPSNIRVEFAEELLSNADATINDIDDAVANDKESIVPCVELSVETADNSKKKDLDRIRIATEEITTGDSATVPSLPDVDLEGNERSSSSSDGDTTNLQIVSGIFSSSAMGLEEILTPDSDKTTPTIFETGKKIDFEFEFYENSGTGIEHFELVTKIPEHKTIYDSELWIEYNKGQKPIIHNLEGLWSSASISVKGDRLNPKVMVSMVFDKPMDASDVILRVWDAKRNSIDIEFENVIKVIESPKSEIIVTPELKIDPEPVFSWEQFDEWTGYSESNLTDEEFLKHLEIDGKNIPSWIKQNNAKWVKQGLISQDELVIALENLKNRGII